MGQTDCDICRRGGYAIQDHVTFSFPTEGPNCAQFAPFSLLQSPILGGEMATGASVSGQRLVRYSKSEK